MKTITWLTVCLMAGCSVHPPEANETKIYGGSKVKKGQWLSTVGITNRDGIFCTGTALTPRLIITAAHCLLDERPRDIRVYVGSGAENGAVKGQYAVARAAVSPRYDDRNPNSDHDIGYIVLRDELDIPESAFIPLAETEDEREELLQRGRPVKLVGFGEREDGAYGVKFEVSSKIKAVKRTEVIIGGEGKDACYGDSGGPAFGRLSNGEWRVFGVVSRGDDCGEGGTWGLIESDACWIQDDSGITLPETMDFCGPR